MLSKEKFSTSDWGVIILWAILPFSFALNPTSTVDLSVVRLLIPLIFLLYISESLLKKRILLDTRFRVWVLIFFTTLIALSFFWSPNQTKAIRKILFLFSILPFYWIAFYFFKKNSPLLFLKILFFSAFFLSLLGIGQFILQFLIGVDHLFKLQSIVTPFFLGNNFSETVLTYNSWLVNVGGETFFRSIGTFPDPHLFSLFLNIALPTGIFIWLKEKKAFHFMMILVILLASLLTFSRAGYLSLIMAFLFFWLRFLNKKNIWNIFLWLFFVLFLITPNPINQRLYSTLNLQDGSITERLKLWGTGIQITKNNFNKGVGIGNLSEIIEPSSDHRTPIYAHNLFLDFSSEIGFWGGLSVFLLIITPIIKYFQKPTNQNFLLATIFIIILIHSMFETPFYSTRLLPLILSLLAL
jgi:O-antigen ligase